MTLCMMHLENSAESPGVHDDSPQSAEEEELLSDWFCVNPGLVSPGQVLSDPEAINLYHFTTFPPSCYFL